MARIDGNGLDNILPGTNAGDVIRGFGGNDDISGRGGNDRINGGSGDDQLEGDAGSDLLEGGNGRDRLEGGTGDDRLFGGSGNDRLFGGKGSDLLDGGTGADTMRGEEGDDIYVVDNVGDQVFENPGEGTDLVRSSITFSIATQPFVENVTLIEDGDIDATGNDNDNILTGNSGNNVLTGNGGIDTLLGEEGDDRLIGGAGADALTGGDGDDVFVFGLLSDGIDTISDFDPLSDVIEIAKDGFAPLELVLGPQDPTFRIGAIAGAETDRFIYDAGTGALFFDSDGTGAGAQVQFAQLTPNLAMTGQNIVVV